MLCDLQIIIKRSNLVFDVKSKKHTCLEKCWQCQIVIIWISQDYYKIEYVDRLATSNLSSVDVK